jgi:hypothetical protein
MATRRRLRRHQGDRRHSNPFAFDHASLPIRGSTQCRLCFSRCRSRPSPSMFKAGWTFQEPEGLAARDRGAVVSKPVEAPKHADHDCGTGCGTPIQHEAWLNG